MFTSIVTEKTGAGGFNPLFQWEYSGSEHASAWLRFGWLAGGGAGC